MHALVLQHIAAEGPGGLAPMLATRGWQLETVALYDGAQLPAEPRAYQAIIVMGGPMGVYDDAAYPFLRAEHRFLHRALTQQVPLLGICLGSQLLAKVLGARVYRNPVQEIGWDTVDLTPDGLLDPLFEGVSSPIRVLQWHGDAFDLPAGATVLASSGRCQHQAFRYHDQVYGVLFHLELTPVMIQSWVSSFREELLNMADATIAERMIADTARYFDVYEQTRTHIFGNLFDRIWQPSVTPRS